MKNIILLLSLFILGVVFSCKKSYNPPAIAVNTNYLVVEGLINTGADTTTISLSRTIKLDSNTVAKPEPKAAVSVQDENNNNYPLTELAAGKYSALLNLSNTHKYKLHILTADGNEYTSELLAAINTPDIDSIPYKVTNTGIQFYVNTHDPQNKTRYYRWSFEETWAYVSFHQSIYQFLNGKIVPRSISASINTCYKSQFSKQIVVGSSEKLAQDIINLQPVNYVAAVSGKISNGYSFLLKQYGLTQAAYSYWENLKKNTENLGSIFDAQPSTITGNIHCITHPEIPVLGFISVSTVKSKRIFIDHNNIALYTPYYIPPPDTMVCRAKSISIAPASSFDQRANNTFARGDSVLITDQGFNGVIYGYSYAPKGCIDCRLKPPFGTTIKPPFFK
ncbi:DUF4249 domain-containing protein [Mucilaginibacter sp.]|uniref:DUF4249 domain-containing protein n=1 Tax=Mucilaginibacter sp. TaxID=1882438 RepID=UPI003AFFFF13